MSVSDRERFLQCVAKCGILSESALEKWMAKVGDDGDAKDLARDLCRRKLATRWQAKMLLKGANRLSLGNYLLTERVGQTDFGDRFTAVHRQLSREVAIQYLPTDICASAKTRKQIFEFGSKLAQLDHPNLIHVYDIDEERGRIYLVSEATTGVDLSEAMKIPMSGKSVAKIIAGCLRGLNYAHGKGVVHGSLSGDTVIVNENGGVQINGLTRFAVRNALSDSPVVASEDIAAVAIIGDSLLEAVSDDERNTKSFATLASAISAIRQEDSGAVAKFEAWINENSKSEQTASDELSLATASAGDEATSTPAIGVDGGLPQTVGAPMSLGFAEASSDGFLTSLARKNPVALIAITTLSAILLIGGTVFAAAKITAAPPETGGAIVTKLGNNLRPAAKPKTNSRTKSAPAAIVTPLKSRQPKNSLSEDVTPAVPVDAVTDPSSNKAAIAAMFKQPTKEAEKIEIEVVTKKENPVAMPLESNPAVSTTSAAVAPSVVEPEVVKTITLSTAAASENDEQQTLEEGEDPFKSYAKTVHLPDSTDTAQVSFGRLILEKKHLLGAEILSTPTTHRSKPIFTLSRSSDDRQSWDIGYKKKEKSDPVIIAKLKKTPNELFFNWLPAAAEVDVANYLRNCCVKISTSAHSHWVTLRKPVKIEGFQLGTNKGTVKLEVEIPWMPNPVAMGAQLSEIKYERQDRKDYEERAFLSPATISSSMPARMYFHKVKAYQFLSLDVGVDIRKELVLHAALVMEPVPSQPVVVLEDPAMLPQIAARIRQMAFKAQQQNTQAQASNLKTDEKKVYKSAASKMTDRAERVGYLEHVVPQLLNKDIPVTITYALDDQHQIVLAHSGEGEEKK